ncbi:MAG: hypothetical protein IJH00_01095 [Erysipelotrichaceae bacterium]|nr:hypothetical protein [Erysipelotrichaceae bacterium]
MAENITAEEMKTLLKSQQGELDAVLMYNALAETVKDEKDAETFRQLAKEEAHHASVFKVLSEKTLQPKRTKAILLPILYRILGKKILYPFIARGEYNAVKTYEPVAERFPEVESVRNDEQRHGDIVKSLL